jgi:hypothetical protein
MKHVTDILREIRNGKFLDLASAKMQEIVIACASTSKPGQLTIKIDVLPHGDEGEMRVGASYKATKLPEPDIGDSTFFATPTGDLLKTDPRQSEMRLTDVNDDGSRRTVAQ